MAMPRDPGLSWLRQDVEDLEAVLRLRFGALPDDLRAALRRIQDPAQANRLVLVAANAKSLTTFRLELEAGATAFRVPQPADRPPPRSAQA